MLGVCAEQDYACALPSRELKYFLSVVTGCAVAQLETRQGVVAFSSIDCAEAVDIAARRRTASQVRSFDEDGRVHVEISDATPQDLALAIDAFGSAPSRHWAVFEVRAPERFADRVILALGCDTNVETVRNYLGCIWLLLREGCLLELEGRTQPISDPFGPGWDLLDRVDVAMFLLEPDATLFRHNSAAQELLEAGHVLIRQGDCVLPAHKAKRADFRAAIRTVGAEPCQADQVLFLESRPDGRQLPVTLTRHRLPGAPTEHILAMLPTPPSPDRIEALVRRMGLTCSEARVAALLQSGLSNREAAKIAGVQPQTFNTYAKRVLSKLNVSCRAEMAQMLTWQAAGGRSA